jgi:lipopolysaccharide transport system permease protein
MYSRPKPVNGTKAKRFFAIRTICLPHHIFTILWLHRVLISELATREFQGLYRTSLLGIGWALLNPLLSLAVYTFVFGLVLKVRWQVETQNIDEFALILFTGLIVFNFFADSMIRAPGLMLENVNYIKKIKFPLEILPWVVVIGALIKATVSLMILFVAIIILHGLPPWTAIFLPLVFFPLLLFALAVCWFLSSIGVYIRDTAQIVIPVVTLMFFISPVFYPVTAMPAVFRNFLYFNPVTFIIEQGRDVLLNGVIPNFTGLLVYSMLAWLAAWVALLWFSQTRHGFSDVI